MATLESLLDDYLAAVKARGKRSPLTVRAYRGTVEKFASSLADGMETDVDQVTPRQVREWLGSFIERDKTSSAKTYFERLRSFFNWMVEEEVLEKSPLKKVDPPEHIEEDPEILSEGEVRSLLKACSLPLAKNKSSVPFDNARDNAIILLMLDIGPRASEVAGIKVEDIDFTGRYIHIVGKGGKKRSLSFGATTENALRKYRRARSKHKNSDSPFFFLGQRGALGYHGMWAIVDRRAKAAKMRHVRPHVLRHTFAHYFRLFGGNDTELMYLGGWSRLEMVVKYGKTGAKVRAHEAHGNHSPADYFAKAG